MSLTILKIIALISMTIDHTLKILPSQPILVHHFGMSLSDFYYLLTAIIPLGRIAYPIFAFCVAEGCIHTGNKKRYLLRLLAFALIAEIPFRLAFNIGLGIGLYNVIFTMLIGAAACMGYGFFRQRRQNIQAVLLVLALALMAELLNTDYGGFGVLLIAAPYIVPSKKARMAAVAGVLTVFYLGYTAFDGSTLTWLMGDMTCVVYWLGALAAVVLLCFYNGKRGRQIKFSFYIYYPLHLGVLYGLQAFITPLLGTLE